MVRFNKNNSESRRRRADRCRNEVRGNLSNGRYIVCFEVVK
jgi:hypothetical protein